MGRKLISPIYHSTAILREAHGKPRRNKKGKYREPWTPAMIPQYKINKANTMRNNPTSLERLMYASIERIIGPNKLRWERQSIQWGYILDAFIPSLKLCLEADGPMHNRTDDAWRDKHLRKCGIKTVRFTVKQLTQDPSALDALIRPLLYRGKR